MYFQIYPHDVFEKPDSALLIADIQIFISLDAIVKESYSLIKTPFVV